VCAVATALRFYRIDAQSLWYDEGISAYQLTRSFAEIARAAAGDTHPPLYYWLLKLWGTIFGSSELGLRSLSAVLGVAAVALTWLIGRQLFGQAAAAVAAFLLACSPLAVYYAQEVRMYTLVVGLGLLAAWAYLCRAHWIFALAAAGTAYSHYLGWALLAGTHLHAVLWWRSLGARGWVRWALANGAALLAFVPWLPVFLDQSAHRGLNTSPRTMNGVVVDTFTAYGGGLDAGPASLTLGVLLVVLAALGMVLAKRQQWFGISLAFLLWVVPLALVGMLGLRSGLFELRYLLMSVPGLTLLAGFGIARIAQRMAGRSNRLASLLRVILLAGVLIPAVPALGRQYFDPSLARDDYRAVARDIESQAQPSDAIVLSAPNQVEVFSFYYHGSLPIYALPAQRPIDVADTERRLGAIQAQHPRVWLVSWATREADPTDVIETWLMQNGFQASHQWYGTVQVSLIALAQPTTTERVDLALNNGIDLEAFRIGSRSLRPGDTLALTLVWRARESPGERWKVFTHLLDARPLVVAQRDAEPGGLLRPTTTWQVGEVVEDNYGIVIPSELPPGSYWLEVGMYQESGRRATFAGRDNHLVLGRVQVER
jgi:mannosyltransferase